MLPAGFESESPLLRAIHVRIGCIYWEIGTEVARRHRNAIAEFVLMGCVQGKCYSRRSCFCCCRYSSSTSCSSGWDDSTVAEVGPVQGHVLTGSTVSVAAVPAYGLCLQYSSLSLRGNYPDTPDWVNQDAICIRTSLQGNPNLHFFGVFDGHGEFGAQCANFVRDKLVDLLSGDTELVDDPVKAYNSAFLEVNSLLHNSEIDDTESGTTAITVLVNGDTLFVANVGDSRAVLGVYEGDRLVAEELSNDQIFFRKDEYERVKQCVARVLSADQVEGEEEENDEGIQSWGDEENDEGDPLRLWVQNAMYPGTAFTRSVGDSTAESIGVIAVPEVLKVKITQHHLFFVIASDGIFKFLSSQAVVNMVGCFKDPRDACSMLAAESYKKWLEHRTRIDDITVIIAHIKYLCDPDTGASTETIMKASVYSEKARTERYLSAGTEGFLPNSENSSELQSSRDAALERCPACVAPPPDGPCP